jgi:hypothetical protein
VYEVGEVQIDSKNTMVLAEPSIAKIDGTVRIVFFEQHAPTNILMRQARPANDPNP